VVVGDDKVMQERLGHADIGVTLNTYTHTVSQPRGRSAPRPGLRPAGRLSILRVWSSPPATAGLEIGDVEGAFVAGYDAYRMAAESLLVRQGLRATGGEGSHVTVEDAVAAQFAEVIDAVAKHTLERFLRTRHAAQ
jgi:hypothetical protein